MSKRESVQKRLQRVRPPRVQLTYDVERGDAIEQKELPFVLGVMGDFAAQSVQAQERLRDRRMVSIDMDNFDDVMKGLAPRASFRVTNRMSPTGGEIGVDLSFQAFSDFRPEAVIDQVEPLRKLMEIRTRLADMRNKLAGNDRLEDMLSEVLQQTEQLEALRLQGPAVDEEVGR